MMLSLATSLMALGQTSLTTGLPAIPREFRAAWVATVDNIDWPSKRTLTTDQQKQELRDIFNKAREMKLNAIIFQIRPSADALYKSKLEPWSEYLTNRQGQAPSPEWDPLSMAVEEAHKAGMELHVWFNPYRANHPSQKGPISSDHIGSTNPELVKQYGTYLWMDPGEPAVQKRSLDVILDVVKRYDIDGVHIDDYFYPYPIKDAAGNKIDFPDGPSWAKYQANGGTLRRDDWRRKNVDDFIENTYNGIKKTKRYVKFGISPFGIARPGKPASIKGFDQYTELYADAELWLKKGWCDYFTPQLYWPIDQVPQAYPTLLNHWLSINDTKKHVWPGLYTSKTAPTEKTPWKPSEIVNQIKLSRERQPSGGNVHFSFKSLQQDWNGIGTTLKTSIYTQSAFVPATPWLGDKAPNAPKITIKTENGTLAYFDLDSDSDVYSYAVSFGTRENGKPKWGPWVTYTSRFLIHLKSSPYIAAVAFSRNGIASKPTAVEYKK